MNPFISPAESVAQARALAALEEAGVPIVVGGAWALFHFTGVCRYTKDLDVFLRREDEAKAREILSRAGYRTLVEESLWLSKAWWGEVLVDLIYSSGNGVAVVDDDWLRHARPAQVLGVQTRLVPPEEMIWSKAFVQERERWDGADVAHIVRGMGQELDWPRLLSRFEDHWAVLYAHLVLFAFSYPHDRRLVPAWVWETLQARTAELRQDAEVDGDGRVCRGTLLSRTQYMPDIGLWGYRDARELEVPLFEPMDAHIYRGRFAQVEEEPSAAIADER